MSGLAKAKKLAVGELVTYLQRIQLQTSYVEVVDRLTALAERLWHVNPAVVVDATGVGQGVVDALRDREVPRVVAITMTGGTSATLQRHVGDGEDWNVGRETLLRDLSTSVFSHKIEIAPLAEREQLLRELGELRLTIKSSGIPRHTLPESQELGHRDLAVSVALGAWYLSRSQSPVEFGTWIRCDGSRLGASGHA